MLPSPQELTYFSEVANNLSLSRASKKLHVTQPTLSLAIKKLEHNVGTHLFIRHKQGVTLTPAGEKLLSLVRPLLKQWDQTKIDVKSTHDEVQGKVTIGCRSVTPVYMKDFLKHLMEQHPKLEINFQFLTRDKITEAVVNSTIDIGVVSDPIQHNDLIMRQIGRLELGLWTGKDPTPFQDLQSGKTVVICEANVPQAKRYIEKLERDGIIFDRVITVENLEVVAQFTATGMGLGILPPCLASLSFPDTMERVPHTALSIEDLCLIYRPESKQVLAVKTMIDAIMQLVFQWEERKADGVYGSYE